ncbi:HemK family modification methylase [Candidatus Magnetomorum sp. HK-1]|nr:HemK family modification methylase [Candidatus Magnetomorum sp. HK-1]
MITEQWTIKAVLNWTQTYFEQKSVESPRLSAELLMADTLALERIELYLQYDRPLEKQELQSFKQKMFRRVQHEPIAYITGSKAFWESSFDVSPQVLIPRPDTETLIEAAISQIESAKTPLRILELGVGSGAIIVSLAKQFPQHTYFATDRSYSAICTAKKNANKILQTNSVFFILSDWFSGLSAGHLFHLIISNPPYIPTKDLKTLQPDIFKFEPLIALDGGDNGLFHLKQIIQQAADYLEKDGTLMLETGFDQRHAVESIASSTGKYENIKSIKDYAGHERVVLISPNKCIEKCDSVTQIGQK